MTAPLRLVWSDGHEVAPRAPDGIECGACGRTYVDRDLYDRHSCREAVRADRVEAVIVLALVAGLAFGALIASGRLP